MQKELIVGDINYELFKTKTNENVESFILDSRYYNNGLDFFWGSDGITSYVYLVKKTNSLEFIEEINNFINKCEKSNFKSTEYLESINDFAFLYKKTTDSSYDFFVTNFDLNMCESNSYNEFSKEHELFVNNVEKISDLCMYAGANFDDHSIFDITISYLLQKNKKKVKEIYKEFKDDLEYFEEDFSIENYQIINNVKNDEIILKFIKIYFNNIPKAIQDENNFYGLIKEVINN